jgi:hypothetical protein
MPCSSYFSAGYMPSKFTRIFQYAVLLTPALAFFALMAARLPVQLSSANYGGDGGDLLAAVLTGGVPHPSGYPTYLLWAGLLQFLPYANAVTKGALASLIPAAAAVALLAFFVNHLDGCRGWRSVLAGALGAIALAFAPLFAGQAVIVEVYGLHMFFLLVGLWTAALLFEGRAATWHVGALMLLFGLGIGNHLTLLLLAPVLLYAYGSGTPLPQRKVAFLWFILPVLLGLFVYALLPIRSIAQPPINWGNPHTIEGFFWLVSGAPYRELVFGIQPFEYLPRIRYTANLLTTQFTPVGLLLVVLAIGSSPRRIVHWNGVFAWLAIPSIVYAIGYNTNDSLVYLLPAWVSIACWIGLGAGIVWDRIYRGIQWGKVCIILCFTLLLAFIPATLKDIDPRVDDRLANDLNSALTAPINAMILTSEDLDTFPLWYAHFGLGLRPDLRIICAPLLQFDWYHQVVAYTYPDVVLPTDAESWPQALKEANPDRTACDTIVRLEEDNLLVLSCPQP